MVLGLEEVSDLELYKAAAAGDATCGEILFNRHKHELYNFALKMVGDAAVAQSFVQDAFANVFGTDRAFLGKDQFKTWLYAIILSLCRSHIRRKRHGESGESTVSKAGKGPTPAPEEAAAPGGEIARLQQAVFGLPERELEALIMSKYEKMSHEQIGRMLGCSSGAVKTLLYRAMESLRKVLREAP